MTLLSLADRGQACIGVLLRKRRLFSSQSLFEMLKHTATYVPPRRPWILHQIALERLTLHLDMLDRQHVGFTDVRTRGGEKKKLAFISEASCGGCQGSDVVFRDPEHPPESLLQRKPPSGRSEARGRSFACTSWRISAADNRTHQRCQNQSFAERSPHPGANSSCTCKVKAGRCWYRTERAGVIGISYQATAGHMSPSSGHEWESKVKLVHGSIRTAEDGGWRRDKGDFVVCMCRSRNVEATRRSKETGREDVHGGRRAQDPCARFISAPWIPRTQPRALSIRECI